MFIYLDKPCWVEVFPSPDFELDKLVPGFSLEVFRLGVACVTPSIQMHVPVNGTVGVPGKKSLVLRRSLVWTMYLITLVKNVHLMRWKSYFSCNNFLPDKENTFAITLEQMVYGEVVWVTLEETPVWLDQAGTTRVPRKDLSVKATWIRVPNTTYSLATLTEIL